MKKLVLFFVLALCFLTVYSSTGKVAVREPNEAVREPNEFEGGNVHIFSSCCMHIFSSVTELADASALIVKVEILSDLGSFNISKMLKEFGYKDVGDNNICTFYEMKVVDVIKGNVSIGDTIKIRIEGGLYEDTLHTNNFSEKLTKDFGYILFLNESSYDEMPYELTSIAQGYLPIQEEILSLNKKISESSLFSNEQSEKTIIDTIKSKMSSQEDIDKKKVADELESAQNSISWFEKNGITFYEDGYTGDFTKYPDRSDTSETIFAFLRCIKVKEKLNETPNEQVYHVGFYNFEDEIYQTITLTDNAVLCRGDWYTYDSESKGSRFYPTDKKISDILNEVK